MATLRNQAQTLYNIGSKPPTIEWTIVKGDTSQFQVYVADDSKIPLDIPSWVIAMQIKRPLLTPGIITDNATLILTLFNWNSYYWLISISFGSNLQTSSVVPNGYWAN